MAYKLKPGTPFLYDDVTGDIVGIKDADGGETLFSFGGGSGGGGLYNQSVDYAPGASVNNAAPSGWAATKNRLLVTPNAGGSTLTGLDATGFSDGWAVLIANVGATDDLQLSVASSSSIAANRFKNSGDYVLPPGAAVLVAIEGTGWRIVA